MSDTVHSGDGYAVAHIDDLGEGPGFRKIRGPLGVTAFGANALVLPSGMSTGWHYHDRQQELYFVHQGALRMTFGSALRPSSRRACDRRLQRRFNREATKENESVTSDGMMLSAQFREMRPCPTAIPSAALKFAPLNARCSSTADRRRWGHVPSMCYSRCWVSVREPPSGTDSVRRRGRA